MFGCDRSFPAGFLYDGQRRRPLSSSELATMHLLFDARLLHRPLSGLERVQRNVIRELAQRPEIRRLRALVTQGTTLPDDFPKNVEVVPVNATEDILKVLLADKAEDRPDVYHLSYFPDRTPRDVLLLLAAKTAVVEVHDAILNRHPEYHQNQESWAWYHAFVRLLVGHGQRILVHSESGKQEAIEDLGAKAEHIDVAPLAVDPSLTKKLSQVEVAEELKALGVAGDYFMSVGKDYPHKDHATMFRALAQLKGDSKIVCAGDRVWDRPGESSGELLAKLGLQERVIWQRGLSDRQIKALLQGSKGLLYPSLEEGFGLPPIEAMNLGVPVVAAECMSIPEVCGDGAWLFAAGDDKTLCELMRKLLATGTDVRELAARGMKRAKQFSWSRCVDATLKCYEKALQSRPNKDLDASQIEALLQSLGNSPFSAERELLAWQDRCLSVENSLRELGGGAAATDANGQPRPRWSLKRRLGKIRAALSRQPD